MSERVRSIIIDESGPIRYDWPGIKLLYVAGAGCSEIAHSMTAQTTHLFERVRAAIAQRCSVDEWPKLREAGLKLSESRPVGSKNNDSLSDRLLSRNITATAGGCLAARKNRYLDITSKFIDRASDQLDKREISSLEQAALAAKLMQPVHEIAKDVHGLNSKDGVNQVNVNILSQWTDSGPPAVEVESHDTSRSSSHDSS